MEEIILPISGLDRPGILSEEEQVILCGKLLALLGQRTARYTMGDSSSVPSETARELLTSICFTLETYLNATGAPPKLLVTEPLEVVFEIGLKYLEEKIIRGKHLWQSAYLSASEIENRSFWDTLRNLGSFWRYYDHRFFAHCIPCEIDYQLCRPVPDSLYGIDYVGEYLRRILAENSVLRLFDRDLVVRLLERYCRDYRDLLINLCEPLIANAVGLALIGAEPLSLAVSDAQRARLAELFEPLPEPRAYTALTQAARRFCREAGLSDKFTLYYISRTAGDLYPRIAAALPTGNLSGIFLPFD